MDLPWVVAQRKGFTRWVNEHLRSRDLTIGCEDSIEAALADGIRLPALIEELKDDRSIFGVDAKKMRNRFQIVASLNAVLTHLLKVEGMPLVNISGEDVYGKSTKLSLGLVWTLIRHFHIQSSLADYTTDERPGAKDRNKACKSESDRERLLRQLNAIYVHRGQEPIRNFKGDFTSADRFLCLLNHLRDTKRANGLYTKTVISDNVCDIDTEPTAVQYARVFKAAADEFEIPELLDAEDMAARDFGELIVMTYATYFLRAHQQLCGTHEIVYASLNAHTDNPTDVDSLDFGIDPKDESAESGPTIDREKSESEATDASRCVVVSRDQIADSAVLHNNLSVGGAIVELDGDDSDHDTDHWCENTTSHVALVTITEEISDSIDSVEKDVESNSTELSYGSEDRHKDTSRPVSFEIIHAESIALEQAMLNRKQSEFAQDEATAAWQALSRKQSEIVARQPIILMLNDQALDLNSESMGGKLLPESDELEDLGAKRTDGDLKDVENCDRIDSDGHEVQTIVPSVEAFGCDDKNSLLELSECTVDTDSGNSSTALLGGSNNRSTPAKMCTRNLGQRRTKAMSRIDGLSQLERRFELMLNWFFLSTFVQGSYIRA